MKTDLNELVKKLCKEESGKSQIDAGQARDIFNKIKSLCYKDQNFLLVLIKYLELSFVATPLVMDKKLNKKRKKK